MSDTDQSNKFDTLTLPVEKKANSVIVVDPSNPTVFPEGTQDLVVPAPANVAIKETPRETKFGREKPLTIQEVNFEKIPDELKLDYLISELDRTADLITTDIGYYEYGGEYARLSVLSFFLIDKIAQDKFPNVGDDQEREAERLAGKILMPADILNMNHAKRNLILIGDNLKQQQKIDEDIRQRIEKGEGLESILKKELFNSIFLGRMIRKMLNQEVDDEKTKQELKNMSTKKRIEWVKMSAGQMLNGYQELTELITSLLHKNVLGTNKEPTTSNVPVEMVN